MFDIRVDDGGARIIRDALREYKRTWSGGHPQEQIDIEFLETQFTKMVLEATLDAWPPKHGTGLRFIHMYELCLTSKSVTSSMLTTKCSVRRKSWSFAIAELLTKKLFWTDLVTQGEVRFLPSVIGVGPLRRIPFAVMTVGKDHKNFDRSKRLHIFYF